MSGCYKGYFSNGNQKVEERVYLMNFSYDSTKTELVGFGENDIYGNFIIFGTMDI